MTILNKFLIRTVIGGVLILLPLYLSILLLLKLAQTVGGLIRPISALLPEWIRMPELVTLGGLLVLCFLIGAALMTRPGQAIRERLEVSLFGRLPGYALFRGLTHRMTGRSSRNEWKPALVEIEEGLMPCFIVEELDDGRFTVFVPSVPTPFAGSVYILAPERVHPIDVPFTQAIRAVSHWGSGSKDLVAAMAAPPAPLPGSVAAVGSASTPTPVPSR